MFKLRNSVFCWYCPAPKSIKKNIAAILQCLLSTAEVVMFSYIGKQMVIGIISWYNDDDDKYYMTQFFCSSAAITQMYTS
jgi:hypothetical protein